MKALLRGGVLAATTVVMAGAVVAPATAAGSFFSYQRDATYSVHSEALRVPVRDGGHLACRLHRPADPSGAAGTVSVRVGAGGSALRMTTLPE